MRRYRNAGYGLFNPMLLPGIFGSRLTICPKIVSFAHLCTVQDYGLIHLGAIFRQLKYKYNYNVGHLAEFFLQFVPNSQTRSRSKPDVIRFVKRFTGIDLSRTTSMRANNLGWWIPGNIYNSQAFLCDRSPGHPSFSFLVCGG